ncbi:MAG: Nif3-like dinuclear metal center hexameric protein [Paludibacteraceae bacterium]|jgi:dinuclear metal center YbgI/SA1388 family protein|nr:Nif3-like dinuclear metal center hexameric protein [Paludibacteraceae bacterium]
MTTHQLCDILNQFAPLSLQDSWDNSGLQIDNNNATVTGVLICLDITEQSLQEAIEKGCNVIVAHHPLLFQGVKQIGHNNYIHRCIRLAILHQIAIYANHTPLDKVQGGTNWLLGTQIGLQHITYLQAGETPSYGIIGELTQPMDQTAFVNTLKEKLGIAQIRGSQMGNTPIKRVAICSGSGSFLIDNAMACQADAFICGDLKHHDFHKADNRLLLLDIGHFESEIGTKELFFSLLSKKIPTFVLHLSEKERSPIYCY